MSTGLQAMIFAAGLGSRLAPLTDHTPKCLVPVGGRPMIALVLDRLLSAGVSHVVVNTFHGREQVQRFFASWHDRRCRVTLSVESELLDTGGGLRQALPLFDAARPILVHNCDVATDASLTRLVARHRAERDDATLLVQQRSTSRGLLFDESAGLLGRVASRKQGDGTALGFCGVHVLSPALFPALRSHGDKFSIVDFYLDAARDGRRIRGVRMDDAMWADLGSPAKLARYERELTNT